MIDFLLIAAVMVSGILEAPWIVIPVAAGALAASSSQRAKPHIDNRRIVHKLSLDAALSAVAAVIAAYLVGLVIGRFVLP